MVGCSGSTRQATWKDDCETYDWSDHVLISSLRLGRERERERERCLYRTITIHNKIITHTIDILVEDWSPFLVRW